LKKQEHKLSSSSFVTTFLSSLVSWADGEEGENDISQVKKHFSNYKLSCVSLCGSPAQATIEFGKEDFVSVESVAVMGLGLFLILTASALAQNRAMFYLSGGLLGVLFAVSVVVLVLVFRTAKPNRTQLGFAVMAQVGCSFRVVFIYKIKLVLSLLCKTHFCRPL
jgi:hypothetical protein